MNKKTLKFKCAGQKLEKADATSFAGIVPGSKGYLQAYIDFDTDWNGAAKVAEFTVRGKKEVYPVIVHNGMCNVPNEVTGAFEFTMRIVGKHGDQKIITNRVIVSQGGV